MSSGRVTGTGLSPKKGRAEGAHGQPTTQVHADVEAGRVAGGALGTEAAFHQACAVRLGGAEGMASGDGCGDRWDHQAQTGPPRAGRTGSQPSQCLHHD